MSLTIEDPQTIAAIRRLAEESQSSVEEVMRRAMEAMASREAERIRRRALLHDIQETVASWPSTGLKADKAFYDSLNDDDR